MKRIIKSLITICAFVFIPYYLFVLYLQFIDHTTLVTIVKVIDWRAIFSAWICGWILIIPIAFLSFFIYTMCKWIKNAYSNKFKIEDDNETN